MIDYKSMTQGVTHPSPCKPPEGFEIATITSETQFSHTESYFQVCVPQKHLLELTMTPNYISWQGGFWKFCCNRSMVYIGSLTGESIEKYIMSKGGADFFTQLETSFDWDKIKLLDSPALYLFNCKSCKSLKGYIDFA